MFVHGTFVRYSCLFWWCPNITWKSFVHLKSSYNKLTKDITCSPLAYFLIWFRISRVIYIIKHNFPFHRLVDTCMHIFQSNVQWKKQPVNWNSLHWKQVLWVCYHLITHNLYNPWSIFHSSLWNPFLFWWNTSAPKLIFLSFSYIDHMILN